MRVVVLRLGHRLGRDKRVSTHVGLVARAFGASGIIYVGEVEESVLNTLRKVVDVWGGPFSVETAPSYRAVIRKWKEDGGLVVHLTMYGENIEGSDVLERIRSSGKDILVVVGAEKVPRDVYEMADFNVAIGNQPHSEVSALAVFLDRLFKGAELLKEFEGAKLRVIPSPRGKRVVRLRE
ncbi:MAG: tRNA (cytidine(56)-2'-O)-methyltransferase [Thermofilum sp.]|jgi:tRNA (cytidine56-2'-O)-methyltransferase|nr:tRNA (cytidine(56)-2'-O)-methyltransferase [Thermofilum sp.]